MMPFRALLLALTLAAGASGFPAAAQWPGATALSGAATSVVTTPRVRAELLAYAPEGITPGAPVWLGLQITHQPHWHTYWKNPGDSGLPTELAWTLPPGLAAGDIAWPTPRKIPIGTLTNFGYEDTLLLPVPVTVAPDFKPAGLLPGGQAVELKLHARWLVCKEECIPEEGEFALKLPVQGSTVIGKPAFDAALAARPAALPAVSQATLQGDTLRLRVDDLPDAARGKPLEFFPETPEVLRNNAKAGVDWTQAWDGTTWTATLPLAEHRSASPDSVAFVLAPADVGPSTNVAGPTPAAWRTEAAITGSWPTAPPRATVSPALSAALAQNAADAGKPAAQGGPAVPPTAAGMTFIAALVGALLGGLLLNLMPCVFPILAIKVLAFSRQAGDTGGHRRAALAYTAGVLASMLALAGAMLALRAAGAELGWGFQLQSPGVVAVLAALFTVIGLNLAGVFEFTRLAPQALGGVQLKHPLANDFLSGVLAVVISSPCTAPFMGASLGFAIGLPPAQALLLFAVLGLGLALPYLVAGFVPAVARLLPRPGAWMETLRRLLAFPMFATVAWLVWVLGQQSGIDGAGALLALLVCLTAVIWAFTLRGKTRLVIASLTIACTAALAGLIGHNVLQGTPASAVVAGDARWQPWSTSKVADLHAQGRTVFIDFTAAWCVTCQFNKQTTLGDADVLAAFDGRQVALLRADWTRRDPAITEALGRLGRSGVPVYVLAAPGKAPVVLTEILRKNEVLNAISAL